MLLQLAQKTFWWVELISQFFCNLNFSKKLTYPLGKLRAKFTRLWQSDTTFFAGTVMSPIAATFYQPWIIPIILYNSLILLVTEIGFNRWFSVHYRIIITFTKIYFVCWEQALTCYHYNNIVVRLFLICISFLVLVFSWRLFVMTGCPTRWMEWLTLQRAL